MARVNRGSTNSYRKYVQEGQVIPLHNYSAMQKFEINVLKSALTPDMKEEEPGLPSWIFFRDFTGVQPTIVEENMLGEFDYNVLATVEENLVNFYTYQLQNGIPINTNTILLANTQVTPEMIQQMVINADNLSANPVYQSIKNDFISNRTRILVDYANIINVKEAQTLNKPYTGQFKSGRFVSGTVAPKDECPDVYEKYTSLNYLTSSMIRKKFEIERPGVSLDTDEGKKAIGSWMGEFKPVDKPNTEGVIYMVESIVDTNNVPMERANRLVAYDIRKSNAKGENKRLQVIEQVPKDRQGVDIFFDYLPLNLLYTSSTDKKEAGKDKKFVDIPHTHVKNLTPDLVYPLFKRVLFANCASLVNKWKPFNILAADDLLKEWLESNMNYLAMLPLEEIERNKKVLAQLLPNSEFAKEFTFSDDIEPDSVQYQDTQATATQQMQAQAAPMTQPNLQKPTQPSQPMGTQQAPLQQMGAIAGSLFNGFMNQVQQQQTPTPTQAAPMTQPIPAQPIPAQPIQQPMQQQVMPDNAINMQAPQSQPTQTGVGMAQQAPGMMPGMIPGMTPGQPMQQTPAQQMQPGMTQQMQPAQQVPLQQTGAQQPLQ